MNYIRPPHDQADATWQGVAPRVRPAHDAADATWHASIITADVRVTGPRGRLSMLADVSVPTVVTGHIAVRGPRGRITARADLVVQGRASAAGPRGRITARADLVVQGRASAAGPRGRITARGVAVVRGATRAGGPRGQVRGQCSVIRYELRGIVRDQGVLVNRRVRAYDRASGAFAGEADTLAGAFAIRTGFEPGEYVVLPIDLSELATDYAPPAANRVLSVLAQDVP